MLAIVFSINVLLLGLNVLAGYFLKTIFNDVIGSHDLTNLTTIIFVAVFGYLSIGFGSFFISVLQTKQKYHYHKQLTKTMTIVLGQKSNNFFTKIVPDQFVLLD